MQTRIKPAAVVADAEQWLLKKDFVPAVADLNTALLVAATYSQSQLLFKLLARFGHLARNTSIQKFTCLVDDNFALYISRFLRDSSDLEELSLNAGSLKTILSIFAALSANKSLRLKRLRLTNNTLGTEGAIELAKFIRTQTSLVELRLRDCGFGPIGTSIVMDAIGENKAVERLEFVEVSAKRDEHVSTLARKLATNKHLIYVNLSCNEFTDKQKAIIFSALANNTSIQILDMSQQFLEYHDFDIEAARALEQMLIKNHSLTTLAFNKYVTISPQAAELLASGLRQNKSLRTLDLSDCELDRDSTALILEACAESRSLRCLKLDGRGVVGRTVTVLEDILKSNRNFVRELSIYNSQFRNNQSTRFYLALRHNNMLTAFNCFSHGTLFDPESKCLLETLQYYNCTLQEVNNNKGAHAKEINLLLDRNKKINSGKLTAKELKNIFDAMKKGRLTQGKVSNPYSLQFMCCLYAANPAKTSTIQEQKKLEITKRFLL